LLLFLCPDVIGVEKQEFLNMGDTGLKTGRCSPVEVRPSFSRDQVAFLEDLLINRGCMRAMVSQRLSTQPEKCRACAVNLAEMVDAIRNLSEG
jgi:hypothetical protein